MKKTNNGRYALSILYVPVLFIVLLTSCKKGESSVEVVSNDKTKPGVVTNVKVENLNGSARITYTLPSSQNLLYVLATYNINDKIVRQTKSSYYTDTIMVDGFAKAKEYTVTLNAVSRANIMSDAITVKVNPKIPNYLLINDNLAITPDFGGANFYGFNPNKTPVAIHILSYNDATKGYDEQDPQYLSNDTVNISVRGFSVKNTRFAVFTTDRFGNVSDTVTKELTPLFETQLDKTKFFTYHLGTDSPIGYGWEFKYFFDGSLGDPGWHTLSAPLKIGSFGIGQLSKISRVVLYNRLPDIWGYQNSRQFTIWGSTKDNPADYPSWPATVTAVGTVLGDWINLGNFVVPLPPSGAPPNQATDADKNTAGTNGFSFNMPNVSQMPAVKYVRFQCTQTWAGLDYVHAKEITLFGAPVQ